MKNLRMKAALQRQADGHAGAWKDTIGAVKSINESKHTLTINVEMFGRETPVELNFTEVKHM